MTGRLLVIGYPGEGLENDRKETLLIGNDPKPKLNSDNGSGFTSKLLAEYLSQHGTKHIFGTSYQLKERGKIERLNRWVGGRGRSLCLAF